MPTSVSTSVGKNAVNKDADVKAVKKLLNQCLHLLIPFDKLDENGTNDGHLEQRITLFQRRVVVSVTPDGRVDPGGQTLAKLNENARGTKPRIPLFPFTKPTTHDPRTGARFFGARRSGGRRKHAGVDLKQPPGTPIRAMEDGVVKQAPRLFLDSTFAFTIDHEIFLARYSEVGKTSLAIKTVGSKVKKGDIIAFVGRLNSGNSMLHLELYGNTQSGSLSDRSKPPFQRRGDLLNPMDFVEIATMTNTDPDANARVSAAVTTVLNVRAKPKLNAKVVERLHPGSTFNVVAEVKGDSYTTDTGASDEWAEIDLNGSKGFAAAFFVDLIAPVSSGGGGGGEPNELESYGKVSTRVTSVLNVRDKAGVDGIEVIPGGLASSTVLEIKNRLKGGSYNAGGETRDDWLEVRVNGISGFVAAFFVDPVLRRARVNAHVQSRLKLRDKPDSDAVVLADLSPGTTFSVISKLKGDTYNTGTGPNNRWYEVEHDSQHGFVAAFFADLFDPTTPDDVNTILFTYEPTGASDKTARQDRLPQRGKHGVDASIEMAGTDAARVLAHKQKFNEAGALFDLPPALLAAIASRESRGGNVLRNGFGDGGNAFGIMQVDKRFHTIVTDGGPDGEEHIQQAAGILLDKLEGVLRSFDAISDSQALQTAVSRYNGGRGFRAPRSDKGTTGGDYMNDVWARARFYAETW